jgi:hypothetical protein
MLVQFNRLGQVPEVHLLAVAGQLDVLDDSPELRADLMDQFGRP